MATGQVTEKLGIEDATYTQLKGSKDMAFLTILHILAALLLIGLVLIQDSKGAMGGSLGGGGATNSILGPTGAPHFLFKLTRYVVLIFAITSLMLSKMTSTKEKSVLDDVAVPAATGPATTPAEPAVPVTPAPGTAAPAPAPDQSK